MKVLIADDERHIRIGLSKSIEWGKLGIQDVFLAEDGIAALKICEKEHPEIIITDIRMPGIDGLDFSKEASEKYGAKNVIILSGYSEFEYAQKAIRIGVEEYLLKPVKIIELDALLSKCVEKIKLAAQRDREARQIKIMEILEGKIDIQVLPGDIKSLIYPEQDRVPSEVAVVIVSKDEIYGCNKEHGPTRWTDLLDGKEVLLWEKDNGIVFLEEIETRQDREQYQPKLLNWLKESGMYSMGVSERGFLKDIRTLYSQAESALRHRMYLGTGVCLFYGKALEISESLYPYLYFDKAAIKESVQIIHMDRLRSQIEEQFAYLREKKCMNQNVASELCVAIKNAVFEVLKEKGVDIEGILNRNQELFLKQMKFTNLDSYQAWITDYCFLLLQGLSDLNGKKYSSVISKTVDIINQHYMEDITLQRIADEVNKSTSYFSSVFKKEMGINFSEYLNQVRIRKAKELLKEPGVVIYEVAEKTGFHDYKYFTKVFKKVCGCSPSEYIKK